ncbi:MAG: hypothetical protein L6367_16950 [Cellulomonas sp.]|nr:hypothetical protein [Cellulomonas sp.]
MQASASGDGPSTARGILAAPSRGEHVWRWWAAAGVAAVVLSVLSVLRYTVVHLNADGIEQSVASVQHVTLFFWGQDRFASVVSLLASPIADPAANLFACAFLNALAVHGLLLLLAWLGYGAVRGQRSAQGTALLFVTSALVLHVALDPTTLHQLCIESQPFALSWVAALGAFELWRRDRWWIRALSAGAVGVAVGLSQLSLAAAAAAALVDAARCMRRDGVPAVLRRWVPFAAVWVVWLVVWGWLGLRFGGIELPEVGHSSYLSFNPVRALTGASTSLHNIVAAFRPLPALLIALLAVGGVVAAAVPHPARRRLAAAAGFGALFAIGYWVLLTGNGWVEGNLFLVRYYFPVVVTVVLALGVGLTLGVEAVWAALPARAGAVRPAVVAALSACVIAVVATGGPLRSPDEAVVLHNTQDTAQYVREHDIRFVTGSFWVVLPVLHQVLADGRDAAYSLSSKSSGDRAAYLAALDEAMARGSAEAVCAGDAVDTCIGYLEHWTRPGWVDAGVDCPVPVADPNLGPNAGTCRVLEYVGAEG